MLSKYSYEELFVQEEKTMEAKKLNELLDLFNTQEIGRAHV